MENDKILWLSFLRLQSHELSWKQPSLGRRAAASRSSWQATKKPTVSEDGPPSHQGNPRILPKPDNLRSKPVDIREAVEKGDEDQSHRGCNSFLTCNWQQEPRLDAWIPETQEVFQSLLKWIAALAHVLTISKIYACEPVSSGLGHEEHRGIL